jgi:hypothetical protein
MVRWFELRALVTRRWPQLLGLVLLLAGAAWWWYWFRHRPALVGRGGGRSRLDCQAADLHRAAEREYDRLCRRLRQRALIRQPSETLCQFAHRLEQAGRDQHDSWVGTAAEFMQEFSRIRYRPQRHSPYRLADTPPDGFPHR